MRQQLPAQDVPVAVYLFQPFQKWVDGPIGATQRSRVYSHVMVVLDDQRHAEFASPTHERLSAGTQHCFQCLEANASDRLLPDYRIV
jgi:hypothetical protein